MNFKSSLIPLILLLLFVIPDAGAQDPAAERFNRGTEYFSEGNYEKALEEWTGLYTAGYRSATLDYNIGNAYFKLGNIPGSILFYERARLRKPADENIRYNLGIARAMTTDRLDEIPELFFVRWYDFLSLILSSDNWAVISLVSFIICLAFLSLYFYSSKYNMKVAGFWLAVLALLISLASLSFSLRNKRLIYESNKAIIFSPIVNAKSSPDDSGTDLFVIHEGLRVSVEDEVGEWKEIRLPDGNKGWVPANSLEII
ncbi:MAG TPA: hypothetical protein PLO24_05160 [Bacteroidales bacterium]|jgi:tetratricopeptide (TPR) repeat protein|nr:hypothetical protein [Bacteroidales bacterium]HOS71520.1 hypothetical protein [Bacteroidales bacterium]HQH23363.1 hypothetical protein [Bacteroidales bacterium]HQJ81392.1 hypothetical protein [Bacteroidales bacterium]